MLPHDVWLHYYDRPCEICEHKICINNNEEVYECDVCKKDMCEECVNNSQNDCHICVELMDRDEYSDVPDVCQECLETCEACQVSFHPGCKAAHRKTCHRMGRAKRDLASATAAVEEKTAEVRRTKQKLAKVEEELKAAKMDKEKAQKKLQKLK